MVLPIAQGNDSNVLKATHLYRESQKQIPVGVLKVSEIEKLQLDKCSEDKTDKNLR